MSVVGGPSNLGILVVSSSVNTEQKLLVEDFGLASTVAVGHHAIKERHNTYPGTERL